LKVVLFGRLDIVFLLVLYSNFVPVTHRFLRYSTWNYSVFSDLETRVRGHSRLSEPTHMDPQPMISY